MADNARHAAAVFGTWLEEYCVEAAAVTFVYPKLLWLLLVVPAAVAVFLWWAGRARQRLLTAFIKARLLPGLTVGISKERELLRGILLTIASASLLVALARPQW